MIYLDNNSTTKIDPLVLEEMMPYLTDEYGNAGSLHGFGRKALSAVDKARSRVANLIGAKPSQIIFTSGGTESNNLALFSIVEYLKQKGKRGIVSDLTEHDSILRTIDTLKIKYGMLPTYLDINSNGAVKDEMLNVINIEDVGIVSVMHMNNETGAENDVYNIGRFCSENGILFHTDCVQSVGCCGIDVEEIKCDFLSLSAHKIHAPKGVGALFVKDKSIMSPLIIGGAMQEFGLRGGTQNVAGVVGFGKACEILQKGLPEIDKKTSVLKQLFYNTVKSGLAEHGLQDILHVNGEIMKHGKTLNIRFDGIDSETLLILLDSKGVLVSSGSACRSLESEPSRTLIAMGIGAENARNSIRVSFSKMNTEDEVLEAAWIVAECTATLSRLSAI